MFWSLKGGSGVTVATALVALMASRKGKPCLIAGLDGDLGLAIGMPVPKSVPSASTKPGVRDWLATEGEVSKDGLAFMCDDVSANIRFVSAGSATPISSRSLRATPLKAHGSAVLIDASTDDIEVKKKVVELADVSLLVTRPCVLSLYRASAEIRADGVILVEEPKRVIHRRDVEALLDIPVVATIPYDASIAAAVDAGRLLQCNIRTTRGLEPLYKMFFATVGSL